MSAPGGDRHMEIEKALEDVVLPLGGRVLTESEVAALVQRVGRPV